MMVKLVRINEDELRKYITIGFQEDPVLISDIHISPGTLEHCVDHNYLEMKDAERENNGEFYKVVNGEDEIGFTVAIREPKLIPSFAINIHHREKDILIGFVEALKDLYNGEHFLVALWDKNKRAIGFFVKNGFEILTTEDKMVFLWA